MDKVLNKPLYDKLQKVFGNVAVYSKGEEASYHIERPSLYEHKDYTYAKEVRGGEHYAVRCPYCHKEGKLWISYLANSYTMQDGLKVLFSRGLIICFRCHFNDDYEKVNAFWRMLGTGETPISSGTIQTATEDASEIITVKFPKTVSILDPSVPNRVKAYLMGRRMDLKELDEVYHVGYSEDAKVLLKGVPRIIFPIIQNGEMIAWQGRCLDEDVERWKVPKYQFPPGARIKWALFNSDVARWQPYAVIVEGVTDVIACGKAGVCVFGKTVSTRQVELLRAYWGTKGVIRIPDMDDPEAYNIAKQELSKWNAAGFFKKGAHIVVPPTGKDPGDMTREEIASMIQRQTGINIKGE